MIWQWYAAVSKFYLAGTVQAAAQRQMSRLSERFHSRVPDTAGRVNHRNAYGYNGRLRASGALNVVVFKPLPISKDLAQ